MVDISKGTFVSDILALTHPAPTILLIRSRYRPNIYPPESSHVPKSWHSFPAFRLVDFILTVDAVGVANELEMSLPPKCFPNLNCDPFDEVSSLLLLLSSRHPSRLCLYAFPSTSWCNEFRTHRRKRHSFHLPPLPQPVPPTILRRRPSKPKSTAQ